MNVDLRASLRPALLGLFTITLAACGGGGGGDDEEDVIEDEDATGVWLGTVAGIPNRMRVIVAASGEFVGAINPTNAAGNNGKLIFGTGTVTSNVINASGTAIAFQGTTLPNGSTAAPLTIAAGRVTERVSLTGSYLAGGDSAAFSLNFLSQSLRTPSLATLSGIYSLYPISTTGLTATMTITNTGTGTFNTSNGCVGNGTFTVNSPGWNIYSWTLAVSGCPTLPDDTYSGLATLDDSPAPNAGSNNLLAMYGTNAARDEGFAFFGTDP